MMHVTANTETTDEVQERYRDNFARHLLGVTLYLQSEIMDRLIRDCGHQGLRINYEPYIQIIGNGGARLSDVADLLEISRQAANQTANQIEAAGYIQRLSDPSDGRAKLLALTSRGKTLRQDGIREAIRLQSQMESMAGVRSISRCIDTLTVLNRKLGLMLPSPGGKAGKREAQLAGLLPRLRDYITLRLMHLTSARGHPDLKPGFGQVLTAIGPGGGRIRQMAQAQGVSKQAIGATVTELEDLGYLHRVPDPADARQVLLHFSGRGRKLISDSVSSVDAIVAEFSDIVGSKALNDLCDCLRTLYRALHLEEDVFGNSATVDIRVLAKQLCNQLGEEGARALGQILLSPSQDVR